MNLITIHSNRLIMGAASQCLELITKIRYVQIDWKVSNFFDKRIAFSCNSSKFEESACSFRVQQLNRNGVSKKYYFIKYISLGQHIILSILLGKLTKRCNACDQLRGKSVSRHQYIGPFAAFRCRGDSLRDIQSQNGEDSLHPSRPININTTTFFPKPTSNSEVIHA